jgi:hypothetical protein
MIKFDTSEIDKFINSLDNRIQQIEKGKEEYLKFLENNVHIEGRLKAKINELVYNESNEPKVYQWTYHLREAIKCKIEKDKIYLYMDDEWLGQQEEANEPMSSSKGYDPSVHQGEGYAKNVEYGRTYENKNRSGVPSSVRIEGSNYMLETFNELVEEIKSEKAEPARILYPLFNNWSR